MTKNWVILLLALCLFACSRTAEVVPPSIQPTPMPDFELNLLQGGTMSGRDFKGKWVVLNIWATWCPPCVREIPDFIVLQGEFADKNVQFVGISVDDKGAEEVQSFAQRVGFNYPILLGNINDISEKFGQIDAIPTTLIIDPDWNLVNRHTGMLTQEVLREELKQWLASKKN